MILLAYRDIEETIKRSVQPYFALNGKVRALLAAVEPTSIRPLASAFHV
jgi:hypothetical protein